MLLLNQSQLKSLRIPNVTALIHMNNSIIYCSKETIYIKVLYGVIRDPTKALKQMFPGYVRIISKKNIKNGNQNVEKKKSGYLIVFLYC